MAACHPTSPSLEPKATAAMGHEDAFPRPRANGRCRFSEGTFAGTRGNGRDAPIPVIYVSPIGRLRSTHSCRPKPIAAIPRRTDIETEALHNPCRSTPRDESLLYGLDRLNQGPPTLGRQVGSGTGRARDTGDWTALGRNSTGGSADRRDSCGLEAGGALRIYSPEKRRGRT